MPRNSDYAYILDWNDEPHFYDPYTGEMVRERDRADDKWVDPWKRTTKAQSPYGYSEFFIYGNRMIISEKGVHAVYSDRLYEWDSNKAKAADATYKKRFSAMSLSEVSGWLSIYYGYKVKCVALAEGCNASTGYPYNIIWYTGEQNER